MSEHLKKPLSKMLKDHGALSVILLVGLGYIYQDTKSDRLRSETRSDKQMEVIVDINRKQAEQTAEYIESMRSIQRSIDVNADNVEANTRAVIELSKAADRAHGVAN